MRQTRIVARLYLSEHFLKASGRELESRGGPHRGEFLVSLVCRFPMPGRPQRFAYPLGNGNVARAGSASDLSVLGIL